MKLEIGNRVCYTGPNCSKHSGYYGTVTAHGHPLNLGSKQHCMVLWDGVGTAVGVYLPNLTFVPALPTKDEIHAAIAAAVSSTSPAPKPALPTGSAERKRWPLFSGLLRYFPAALAHVSHHSLLGNEKHNPGLPLQHARGKSGDHEDCILRHLVDAAEYLPGSDSRIEELRAMAWRALALLQEECELAGHRPAPAASFNQQGTK